MLHNSFRTAPVDIYLQYFTLNLAVMVCIRTAPVDIYHTEVADIYGKYHSIRTAPVDIYLACSYAVG